MSVHALCGVSVTSNAAKPAFADVAAAEIDNVYRFLLHMTGDAALADDITSATFERALREWSRFDPRRGRPRAWLVEIARRLALDHFRSESRRTSREQRAAEPDAHDGGVGETRGLSPGMRRALEGLTGTEREIVALRVILDVDTAEAADILGITRTAVSTGLHRALGRLRAQLGPEGIA